MGADACGVVPSQNQDRLNRLTWHGWELDEAWNHIAGLLDSPTTDRPLMFAAIEASIGIRPHEAEGLLGDLLDSEDEEISDAAFEALEMAKALAELDFDDGADDLDLVTSEEP